MARHNHKSANGKSVSGSPGSARVHLTREGWYWLLLSIVLLCLGLYKGINLLCLLAYILQTCLGLNLLLAGRHMRRLQATRRIGEPAFAGEPFPVELRVISPSKATQFGIVLEDHPPGQNFFVFAPRLEHGRALVHRREAMLPMRGRYTWGGLEAVSGYPFGLAQRRVGFLGEESVCILPRLGWLHRGRLRRFLTPVGLAHVPTRRFARRHPTAQAEFYGLRAFRSGDSPRWIHWRTSARCGVLMVREFEDVPTDNLVLLVDPWAPATGAGNEKLPFNRGLEDLVSLAATICWEWCRQKGDHLTLVAPGGNSAVLSGSTSKEFAVGCLKQLAGLEGQFEPDYGPLLDRLAALPLPAVSVLVVSTRDPGPLQAEISHRLHRPASGVSVEQLAECDFYQPPAPADAGLR
jgi:uncharacterized protein (DUF58 family)